MNAKKLPNLPPKKTSAFSLDKVCEALTAARGNVTVAARSLGYTRAWMHMLIAKHPELKAAKEAGEELRLDIAESALDKAVEAGEAWAVCFFLKTRGKARGYTERHEVTGADDGPVRFTIKLAD